MKVITKQVYTVPLFVIFCFSSLLGICQGASEKGYRGELMRWNQFQLDSLWQFSPGDGGDIASLPKAIENWTIVNTEFLTDIKGQPIKWNGVGWFKKKFDVPAAFRGKPLALRMGHYGASEIFIDGKLICRYGTVGNSVEAEKIFIPRKSTIIQTDSQAFHIITVHYSNQHSKIEDYPLKLTGFRLLIAPSDVTYQQGVSEITTIPVSIGILFMFFLFFLFVYLFDLKRLASLLTAITLLSFSCVLIGTYLESIMLGWEGIIMTTKIILIATYWTNCWLLLVLYALYYHSKMPARTWLVAGIMILIALIHLYQSPFLKFSGILHLLVIFEIYRTLISGIKNKKSGFWILALGAIIQQIGFFVIVIDVFGLFPIMTKTQEILLLVIPQMSLPLTYALHLAWEFGKVNRDLRVRLQQVEQLSETTLRHEKEKQQILIQQKDTLEQKVSDRTKELSLQKETLQYTLTDLKATQAQLIQKEKLASLGELTAGIAHEIQNPLNFVNNFSELSVELLEELKAERQKAEGKRDFELEDELLSDLSQNQEKINHHGKRASSIVKGMLEHSRKSTGEKELTDINALADEYLRLAYHGLRAKDKDFNADFTTDFDESLPKILVIPQDIGRVLLNLINNAFYATYERSKKGEAGYEPKVTVSTQLKANSQLLIAIKDNGSGIPPEIKDKIFQPFFTTKPTGEGTGLGLSLAYDIVTKGHGGTIEVESAEGKGTEFIVKLPIQNI